MNSKKACARKRQYTKKAAERICHLRNKDRGGQGSIYKCDHCGNYHVTKEPRISDNVWGKI